MMEQKRYWIKPHRWVNGIKREKEGTGFWGNSKSFLCGEIVLRKPFTGYSESRQYQYCRCKKLISPNDTNSTINGEFCQV
jgi:hypothetical protein